MSRCLDRLTKSLTTRQASINLPGKKEEVTSSPLVKQGEKNTTQITDNKKGLDQNTLGMLFKNQ